MTLPSRFALAAALAAATGACGDDGPSDAGVDGPPDPCAPNMTFNGEYVSWDSGASFMGINGATFTLRSDPSINHVTAPNGRFEMCIPAMDGFVDITPAAASDVVPGTVVADKGVLKFLPVQSYRSFTRTRAADFGFDEAKAHVYVHINGGSRMIGSSVAAGTTQMFDGTAWSAGDTGTDIYLGNLAPMATTKLTVTGGGFVGNTTIPLTAGQFTYVTLLAKQ